MKTYLLALVGTIGATTTLFATCPQPETIPFFLPQAYMGTWYEIARDIWNPSEFGTSCVTAHYTLNSDNTI